MSHSSSSKGRKSLMKVNLRTCAKQLLSSWVSEVDYCPSVRSLHLLGSFLCVHNHPETELLIYQTWSIKYLLYRSYRTLFFLQHKRARSESPSHGIVIITYTCIESRFSSRHSVVLLLIKASEYFVIVMRN